MLHTCRWRSATLFFAALGQPLLAAKQQLRSTSWHRCCSRCWTGCCCGCRFDVNHSICHCSYLTFPPEHTHTHTPTHTHTSHAILPTTIPICPFAERPLAVYSWKLDCSCTAAVRTYRRCTPDRNYAEIPACFCQISTEVRSSVQTDIDRFFGKVTGAALHGVKTI